MNWMILCTVLTASTMAAAHAGTNVSVSIGVSQPGAYGRIDFGSMAPPPVVYAQPVIVTPAPVVVPQQPVYLYVPPEHQSNWKRHCGAYGACAQPVYFVQEAWVKERHPRAYYSPPKADERGTGRGNKNGHGRKGDD